VYDFSWVAGLVVGFGVFIALERSAAGTGASERAGPAAESG
jgi:hypothetical protein